MLKKLFICTCLFSCTSALAGMNFGNPSFSQAYPDILKKEKRVQPRGVYLGVTGGVSIASFRDFATSPLFYKGSPPLFSLSLLKNRSNRDTEVEFMMVQGNFTNSYNRSIATSSLKRLDINYSELFRINPLSIEGLNTQIGFLANVTGNQRVNESLLNNANGIEIIPTLFGSIKVTKDISRKKEKRGKLLFLRYRLSEKQRTLAFRTNIGLINSSYRNGFAYINQTSVTNDPRLFEGYRFSIFCGFRMNTALDYTRYLKNHNAVRLSYVWDAYRTSGKYEKLEMASHSIKISLLFNICK